MSLVFAVLTPLLCAFLIPVFHLILKTLPVYLIGVMGLASLASSLAAAYTGWVSPAVSLLGGWPPALGIALVADRFAAPFLLLTSLGTATSLVCSLEKYGGEPWRYYAIFFLLAASMNGILLTADLFNLFVFYEIFSVAAYLMVASSMSWQAMEAGLKYLVLGTIGALFILLGTAFTFMATGILNMALLPEALSTVPGETLTVIATCLVLGFALKTGAFPVHFWLPDAHSSAQTPVSAILSGALVKVSIYALTRTSCLFFLSNGAGVFGVITIMGVLSILGGHLMAFRQDDLKRLLAFSTVAQIGYILVGVGCASAAGIAAAVFHAVNHMLMKMGLFITGGDICDSTGTRSINAMKNTGGKAAASVAMFTIFAAAIVGVPPLNGFMSKWFIMLFSVNSSGLYPALTIAAGTIISAAYYYRVVSALVSPGGRRHTASLRNNGLSRPNVSASSVITGAFAVLCLLLGVMALWPSMQNCFLSIGEAAVDIEGYARLVLGK